MRGRDLGADDYVAKPIDFDFLEEIINAGLTKGFVQDELPAKRPKVAPPPKGDSPVKTAPEHIFELEDAPTDDRHPD